MILDHHRTATHVTPECLSPFHSDSPKNTRAVILPSGQRVEGDSVTLTCSSDANPPVLSYYWFKQSSDVELGTGQNYSITSISSQHSGLYYCTAHNQLGQSSSGPSRLDVLCKSSLFCMVCLSLSVRSSVTSRVSVLFRLSQTSICI